MKQISISMSKRFFYGLRVRPYSIGAQPKGTIEYIEKENVSKEIKDNFSEPDYRYGILVYSEQLSDRDIDHFDLTNMNLISDDEAWTKFVALIKEVKADYELPVDDFIEYYIKPNGDYAYRNPLHKGIKPKPNAVFEFLKKNGYSGNLSGLKKLYDEM